MKTAEQILERVVKQLEAYKASLEMLSKDALTRPGQEGAMYVLEELKRFIEDDTWKA